ncbi:MAG: hypothetical protein A2487_10550 [Candidatus Raymondbacteria bacterium RifOxyC12_full_50_8]|uniref:Lysine transporter LysE n=1 Tax=Candidatus Raymondbacteria bacterium RIFOXYD12_FULL_49_13 TaxID=1817890 RepID=A0A1F7F180_UNCRA|nr:MAG: hypothetical protein A2248_07840 [Candidatus Raymondbacteria bacterium RIFOXYA2_FULL_49_16]OGJ96577.1 MAG: hypothetical protein A2487_10550 [Candidatus Raymondbacteria bacterium RifOxyC12_full_50_8]OGK00256.1 MAG: hypothetical protein A2519_01215 [Candidatus Raymondbacteria bacterium RIFOXYD12_FULL_49_13]OGK02087.1 MAG: hypothetical protein A2350_21240 [Candidatus Raymondbacteria bacterium RifOxyB12_full_50_8]OGP42315.1 MAG: hypothetical protein A2324_20070 [Candidatus Raymondbacteria b
MTTIILSGLTFGLSSGFSPGPLTTLVISHTLAYGTREGAKVALAPLLTDLPIIAVALTILMHVAHSSTILGAVSCIGGLFVLYLAYGSFRSQIPHPDHEAVQAHSVVKGVMVNFLSPNPYLFWMTVGGPLVIKAWTNSPRNAVIFIALFYLCLVGGKILIAHITGKARHLLTGKAYVYFMRFLACVLLAYAGKLMYEGVGFLF